MCSGLSTRSGHGRGGGGGADGSQVEDALRRHVASQGACLQCCPPGRPVPTARDSFRGGLGYYRSLNNSDRVLGLTIVYSRSIKGP